MAPVVPGPVEVLAPFVDAGVFGAAEVQLAATVARLSPGTSDAVLLALAVAARAPRSGHVCIELDQVADRITGHDAEAAADLPWPDPPAWTAALAASPVVAGPHDARSDPLRPLVHDAGRIYLQRYWHLEMVVADELRRRSARDGTIDPGVRSEVLDELFPAGGPGVDLQRRAAEVVLDHRLAVIAGGPGTGKTHTVGRLLVASRRVAAAEGRPLEVALAAPTGKAAARMTEAVAAAVATAGDGGDGEDPTAPVEATTIHRLLGWAPGPGFRHDRHDPLPHDLVLVDETSMVSLPLMARLLDAVRPDARVVLVGDPYQLTSIEAGTVLSDIVGPTGPDRPLATDSPLTERVTVLERVHRFGSDSGIAALADAVRRGDAEAAIGLLGEGRTDLRWVRPDDAEARDAVEGEVVAAAVEVAEAALGGQPEAALLAASRIKVLAATRQGPLGLHDWGDRIEQAVAERVPGVLRGRRWYVGRPVLITTNDPLNRVANGDVGVVVRSDDATSVALREGAGVRLVAPSRLRDVETWWAMTIHKSQGSEFPHAVVSLPTRPSPVLTRELLYTATTRAREQLTLVATEEALRTAVGRPVARASGLRDRLWPSPVTSPPA